MRDEREGALPRVPDGSWPDRALAMTSAMALMLLKIPMGCGTIGEVNASRWHSTAVTGRMHGTFGIACNAPLAGVVPAAHGDFVLHGPPSACGVNLADGSACAVRRPPLAPARGRPKTSEAEKWLRGVQDTREGALLFVNEEHMAFTKELYKEEKCSPSNYGPRVVLRGGVATMRFHGAGLCGANAGALATLCA